MTGQRDFFHELIILLGEVGIPFMVSGSLASSFHGDPRATNDFDIVIDPDSKSLDLFLARLPGEWYVSSDAARSALKNRSMFNVVDSEKGWKADLIIRKDRPFSAREFDRRIPATILGMAVTVVSAEDSILSKLEWSKDSGSQRQYSDALGVALLHSDTLDRSYLLNWAKDLNIEDSMSKLLHDLDLSKPS